MLQEFRAPNGDRVQIDMAPEARPKPILPGAERKMELLKAFRKQYYHDTGHAPDAEAIHAHLRAQRKKKP